MSFWRRWPAVCRAHADRCGVAMVECVLLGGLLLVIGISVATTFGAAVNKRFSVVSSAL